MATKEAPATAEPAKKPAAPAKRPEREYYFDVPNVAEPPYSLKKRKPPMIALHNEDKCTGCQGCVEFCPVNCIEPLPEGTYPDRPIQPVQDRWDECIGCGLCVKVCTKVVCWDAIRMVPVAEFEQITGIKLSDSFPDDPPPVRSLPVEMYPNYPD